MQLVYSIAFSHLFHNMRKQRFLLSFVILVGISIIGLTSCKPKPMEISPTVGGIAPDFTLLNLEGEPVSLSDYRGKQVIINFWATWCGPCRVEMPALEAAYQENIPDLVILAVNIMETPDVVAKFFWELSLSFEPVLDSEGLIHEIYQVRGFPSSFFVDDEGVIKSIVIGLLTEETLKDNLKKIYIY
jgi:thiol-disulfide isomerase/thioredoxin